MKGVFWVPLRDLFDPQRHSHATIIYQRDIQVQPAIDLLGPGRTVLWGITYRLVTRFAQLLETGHHLVQTVRED